LRCLRVDLPLDALKAAEVAHQLVPIASDADLLVGLRTRRIDGHREYVHAVRDNGSCDGISEEYPIGDRVDLRNPIVACDLDKPSEIGMQQRFGT